MAEPMQILIDDIVQMRKPHACGGDTWRVVRIGAEIGLRCQTCQRKVLLPRSEVERRVRRFVQRGTGADTTVSPPTRLP